MTDLICRKTMQRCQTPGMCSPHGGCSDSSAVNPGAPLPGAILAADHDRIVAELQARVDRLSEDSIKDNASFGRAFKELEAERDTLRVEVERLRKDAELWREMQRAASELPDGWEIRVCVERGAGWVELTNQDGEGIADTWSGQESLSCEISDAIDAALEAAR